MKSLENRALETVTLNPARILEVDDRVGSLEPGKDADILILRGHPLLTRSVPEAVFVDGEIVYSRDPEARIQLTPGTRR